MDLENLDWFVQKVLIQKDLPLLKIKYIEGNIKTIEFSIALPGQIYVFKFSIWYSIKLRDGVQVHQPFLFCKNTDIVRHADAHINSNGQICYFYPADLSHRSGISCSYAIKAAIKWADCYDFWIKNPVGGWPCKEMPHGSYAPAYFNIYRPML